MRLRLTNHAKYRLLERHIKMIDVEAAVRHPDRQVAQGGLTTARRKIGQKMLEVVYKKDKNTAVVITAYYL